MCILTTIVVAGTPTKVKPYEVKSDIINFDYTQMAYPVGDASVGVKSTKVIPEKRKPVKDLTSKERLMHTLDEIADGIILFTVLIIACTANFGLFVVLPCIIVYISLMIRDYVKNRNKKKKTS